MADVDVDPISGRKIINEYEIIDELGRGTHGKVKLGRNLNTHEYVAIKIVERYSKKRRLGKLVGDAEDKVKKEVAILKKARHPNIVALLEVIDDPARKKVYIVLERVELGEIVWRTPGPKEIAMIEARRYERESKGIFQDPEADYEDDAILEEARMRRARKQRRLIRQLRRTRRRYHENQPWSIEFGGDTDSEAESDMENASRTSTTTTDTSSAEAVAELERALSRVAASHYGQAESGDATTPIPNEPPTEADLRRAEELARLDLQGTMYGPYGEQSDPSRAPSLASSVHSFHADDFAQRFGSGPHSAVGSDLLDEDIHLDLLYVPCMSIAAARVAFRDTVLGLQYLHYQGIIHRDIKPPNLLQTADHRIKISDFGVSYLGRPAVDEQAENLSESDAQDFDEAKELARTVGTAAFYAPELCYTNPDIEAPPVGKPIDVWALGITLFCMLFGRTPFVDSEFIVMRRIAEEEIYIPRKRLRPVDPKPKSRPTSHGRHFSPAAAGRRDQYELSYEEVDDVLYDLLARLLTKDPNKRITLEEVRHHPWIVQDVANKAQWLEESDPTRQTQGKKIEVSKEDLSEAVVPVIIGRVRDGIRKIGGALLGRNVSTRKRTPSNAGSSMSGSLFPGSGSGSSVGEGREREGRRSSLRGDESIFAALKSSRESEHPLAQSVTVSPDESRESSFSTLWSSSTGPERPSLPERAKSTMSTAGSVRTIRASDSRRPSIITGLGSTPPSPSLTATLFEPVSTPGGTNLGSLLSGAGRRILQGVRDRSTAGRSADRDKSTSRRDDEGDAHATPSLAVSTASAAGRLETPEALRDITPGSTAANSAAGSVVNSPHTSRPQSAAHSPDQFRATTRWPFGSLSRRTSALELDNPSFAQPAMHRPTTITPTHDPRYVPPLPRTPGRLPNESSEADFRRAENEMIRKRIFERDTQRNSSAMSDRDNASRAASGASLVQSQGVCPPSPDDEAWGAKAMADAHSNLGRSSTSVSAVPSLETSPTSRDGSSRPATLVTPSSSEDQMGGFSLSESNPSIPSVTSDASSVLPDLDLAMSKSAHHHRPPVHLTHHGHPATQGRRHVAAASSTLSSDETVKEEDEEEGYAGDGDAAIDTDSDEYLSSDSSDSDGGLQMTRRRSAHPATSARRSLSVSNAVVMRDRIRRETGASRASRGSVGSRISAATGISKKSERSGSGSTMTYVRSRGEHEADSDEEELAFGTRR